MTPGTITHQAPLSVGFSQQEYWSELSFPSARDLPDPGIEPGSPAFKADSLPAELLGNPVLELRHVEIPSNLVGKRKEMPDSLIEFSFPGSAYPWWQKKSD